MRAPGLAAMHRLGGHVHVLLVGVMAAVDHHAGEAFVDAFLAKFESIAVVQVDRDGNGGEADGGLNEFLEIDRVGVSPCALGNLENQRGFLLFAGFDDGLDEFHVVYVEGPDRIFSSQGFGKQLLGMC